MTGGPGPQPTSPCSLAWAYQLLLTAHGTSGDNPSPSNPSHKPSRIYHPLHPRTTAELTSLQSQSRVIKGQA